METKKAKGISLGKKLFAITKRVGIVVELTLVKQPKPETSKPDTMESTPSLPPVAPEVGKALDTAMDNAVNVSDAVTTEEPAEETPSMEMPTPPSPMVDTSSTTESAPVTPTPGL